MIFHTDVQLIARDISNAPFDYDTSCFLPFIGNSLDYEPKRRTDAVDVLMHDTLHNCSFASIVKTSFPVSISVWSTEEVRLSQHQYSHFFVFQTGFPQNGKHLAYISQHHNSLETRFR